MQEKRRGSSVGRLVAMSALCAIGIILGKFLAFNVTEFMRFSLENITILFAGIVFGPIGGALVGAVQDLVGCLAVGYAINPIITAGSAMIGLISGFIYRSLGRVRREVKILASVTLSHLVGSVLIKSAGLAVYYSLPFNVTVLWRLLNYVIVGAVETFLLCMLLKSKQLLTQINKITTFSTGGKIKNGKEAERFAKESSGVFSKPGLERVKELLAAFQNPEASVPAVHVAGTNGKGSFVTFLTSILSESSLKVGAFTSPYLVNMRESITVGGKPIDEATFVYVLDELKGVSESMMDKPTEFELLTAAAYLIFRKEAVDVAVIECGMGGERDATNVIKSPLLSVITGVSVDHVDYLGDSVEKIAAEKAGIIKRGRPILYGGNDPAALGLIKARAEELGAELILPTAEPRVRDTTLEYTVFDQGELTGVRITALGLYQAKNASLAIEAARILQRSFPEINEGAIRRGLLSARRAGRFEILSKDPVVIFDGAHNAEGVRAAVMSVRQYFGGGVITVSGVLRDKDYRAIAGEIASVSSKVFCVRPSSTRALEPSEYQAVLASFGTDAAVSSSVRDALLSACALAKDCSSPVICLGSLYLYREFKEEVQKISQ